METYAVYFRPRGALASTVSSDTLFGAVCWGIQALGLKTDLSVWLGGQTDPPFAFSAPFPVWYARDGKPLLRFYPRPITFEPGPDVFEHLMSEAVGSRPSSGKKARLDLVREGKRLKSIRFVSEAVLADIAVGKLQVEHLFAPKSNVVWEGNGILAVEEKQRLVKAGIFTPGSFWKEIAVQHNQVDRVAGSTGEGLLFYRNETAFVPGAGLWALLRASSADLRTLIQPALRYLADTGLGAYRTTGKGHFDISIEAPPALPDARQANGMLMLSRYLPASAETIDRNGRPLAYRLVTLRPKREHKFPQAFHGQETPPIYKGMVRMFEPGSVFPLIKRQPIYGRLAQIVTESQGGPVYQSGAALSLFIHVEDK